MSNTSYNADPWPCTHKLIVTYESGEVLFEEFAIYNDNTPLLRIIILGKALNAYLG